MNGNAKGKSEASAGLTAEEAKARLQAEGPNELPRHNARTPFRIVLEVLKEPMLALLLGGGVVYLILGDHTEAVILVGFASLSILITVIQESRTERVLEALRDLTSPRALVIRDGREVRIAGREVVRGDIIVLGEGDRVPADAKIIACHDLMTDESLLTGESVPVHKSEDNDCDEDADRRPGGDGTPFVYSGSLVVRGRGKAEVFATGPKSEIGRIGQTLGTLDTEAPKLQSQIRLVVRRFAVVGGLVCLLAVVLYGLTRGNWLEGLLAGIALGMSMLPEEFPMVLTVFMAMGAWRISKARVLTRRAAAIEALGSASVLCTDKTGTLTENIMSIAHLRLIDGTAMSPRTDEKIEPDDAFRAIVQAGVLASAANPFDPMERAFVTLAGQGDRPCPPSGWQRVREYGLRRDLLAVTHVWRRNDDGEKLLVAAKGAPEAIAGLCRMPDSQIEAMKALIDDMAAEGLRVLGVAEGVCGADLPEDPRDFSFTFLGLVGLADRMREPVPAAVAECRSAGIKVIMITGDYPATAKAIATQAGILSDGVVSGAEMNDLSDQQLAERVKTTNVFARIMPEQKLRIVKALKANGEIVAMTGDGVNDAPSIKAANIGIAMGGRGTDVAREASSIVLLDDDFGSIVHAVRLGRRIYDNLVKAMGFIFAVHVPIAGLALVPLIFGLPVLFGPVHIAFLEMVIDPVCSLVFEAEEEEKDLMNRPPRGTDAPLFSARLIAWSLAQGALALGLVVTVFVLALGRGMPEEEVRALVFFSTVWSIVALIFVNRSFSASLASAVFRHNRTLALVLTSVVLMLALTLYWPFARQLFSFGPLHADDLAVAVFAGIALLVILEAMKKLLGINPTR